MRVLSVTAGGAQEGWAHLAQCLSQLRPGGFIGLDTEFSGLAAAKHLEDVDLSVRYAALRDMAAERALLSLGVSLYNPVKSADDAGDVEYEVTSMDFLLKCTSRHHIAADAGEFLVAHAFDFNAMFARGIPYRRAADDAKAEEKARARGKGTSKCMWGPWPRGFLWRLGRAGVPLVVHNGAVDLILCWAAFHGSLPDTLGGFVSAMLHALPAGVYDTKVLAIGAAGEARSFLAYLFARAVSDLKRSVRVREARDAPLASLLDPPVCPPAQQKSTEMCRLFAIGGSCPRGAHCRFSHDALAVVRAIEKDLLPKELKEQRKAARVQHAVARGPAREESRNRKGKKLNKKAKKRKRAAEAAEVNEKNKKQCVEAKREDKKEQDGAQETKENGHTSVTPAENGTAEAEAETETLMQNSKEHSAGWDAFSTAYVFASYSALLGTEKMRESHNRIKLMGRGRALWLCKSQFSDNADQVTLENESKNDDGQVDEEEKLEI